MNIKNSILYIFILTSVIFSNCNIFNDSNLKISLTSISFETKKFYKDLIVWFYPYEITYNFAVTGNKNYVIRFNSNEQKSNIEYLDLFMIYKKDTIMLYSKNTVFLTENKLKYFIAYGKDEPFFDSIYTSNEFNDYLETLKESSFFVKPKVKSQTIKKEIPVKISNDFKFSFNNGYSGKINMKNIGYPANNVPDSISPIEPFDGIGY